MSTTLRRRPIADQARDLYIAARRKLGVDASIVAAAKKLGITPDEVRTLLGFEPKEKTA